MVYVDHQKEPVLYSINFDRRSRRGFQYSLYFKEQKLGQIEESLHVGGKTLFQHSSGKWIVAPDIIPLPTPNGIMLGAIPGLQESTFAYVALRSGIGCYDFPGDVLVGVGNQGHPADHGFADRGENYLLVADRILSDLGKAHSWKRIAKSLRAINRTVGGLTLNAPKPDRLDVGHRLNGRLLSFDGAGSPKVVISLPLALGATETDARQQHPEAGLHPGRQVAARFKARGWSRLGDTDHAGPARQPPRGAIPSR